MISGQSTTSIRKKDMENQKVPATGFTKQFFATKASAGATGINLNSLTTPPEMVANGFVNPTAAQMAASNLLFFKNNLTLVSSARGLLQQNLAYVIVGSTQINFVGFTALEGEIFSGTIDYAALTGLKVVDATATPATGTLPVSTTDFNVGQFFQTNKYSTTQHGACVVYLDGVLQYRNPNNSSTTTTGNYYEVDNGGGSFSVIRFNQIDPDNIRNVTVLPNGLLSERPDGSMMTVIESIQGQINSLAPYLATLASVSTTTLLGSAPTNVDLKAFGDRVLALEQTRAQLAAINAWTTYQPIPGRADGALAAAGVIGEEVISSSWTSTTGIASSGTYHPITSFTLNPGIWMVSGEAYLFGVTGGLNQINLAISTSTTALTVGGLSGAGIFQAGFGASSTVTFFTPSFTRPLVVTTATTYFLIAAVITTTGTWGYDNGGLNNGEGGFYAVRIG